MTIDWWTLGLQTVNVLILIWLLERFFWRPVAAMIETRRAASAQDLAAAAAQRAQAAAALADIEKTRAGFAAERAAILAAAEADAAQARTAGLDEAARTAAALRAAAEAALAEEKKAAEQEWGVRANRLAIDIARRLAERLTGSEVRQAFLDWLVAAIRALPEPVRHDAAADGVTLAAISAAPLPPAEQEQCRKAIGAAFGAAPRIEFTADPALIAGLELHGPHLAVTNSWRADLGRILAELGHDRRP
jgi:F-type H+-transporting ATPase subunit b